MPRAGQGSRPPPGESVPRSGSAGWTAGRPPGSAAARSSAVTSPPLLPGSTDILAYQCQCECTIRARGGRYSAGVITWRNGRVARVRREWAGAAELEVTVEGAAGGTGRPVRALAYPALTGRPEPGDRVLLNTTALDLALGTGGYALVVAVPDRLPPDRSGPGHLVKARYTPLQAIVLGADEQDSPHHDVLRDADDIGGMPVVVADLHSALAPILAGLHASVDEVDEVRVAYVMTDG